MYQTCQSLQRKLSRLNLIDVVDWKLTKKDTKRQRREEVVHCHQEKGSTIQRQVRLLLPLLQ
jgi:hypothetical protein